MSDEASIPTEDEYVARLAAHDDAAAARQPRELQKVTAGLPPALRRRLEQDGAWCEFVRAAWTSPAGGVPPEPILLPADGGGMTRFGRFEVRRELGRGAYGVVFLAFDPKLRRQVALKLPRPEVMVTAEMRARFEREARAAAMLDHPNLVPVFETGQEGPVSFIASAYCPGPTLAEWLKGREEPVSPRLAARIVLLLARGIAHAHARGVLHRDLKPGNVILEPLSADDPAVGGTDGMAFNPRVTDFGLARMSAPGPEATAATQSGEILGTPSYMSPEQADGRAQAIGPTTDVYGLGAILYALLTGRPPFQSHSPVDTILLLRTEEPIPPSRLRPRLPRDLETICLKCLEKESARRYRTAQQLVDDLKRCLAGESIHARPTPGWERALKWAKRRPALAALAGVSAAAIVTVVTIVLVANARLQNQIKYTEARRLEAQRNLEEAEAQRRLALVNLGKARDAVDRMVVHVGQVRVAGSGLPQQWTVQRELFEDAIRYYEDFAQQTGNDPDLLIGAGRARRLLGFTLSALGEKGKAEQSLRAGLEQLSRLAADFPDKPAYRHELASCQFELAALFWQLGRSADAMQLANECREVEEAIIAAEPGQEESRYSLCQIHNLLGMLFQYKRQAIQAEKSFREGLAVLAPLLQKTPPAAEILRRQAIFVNNLGELFGQNERYAEAEQLFLKNQLYWEDLSARVPTNYEHRSKLALTSRNLAIVYMRSGRTKDAELAFRRAADLRQKLTDENADEPHHRNQLGDALRQLSILSAKRGERLEACRLLEQAVRHHQLTVKQSPSMADFIRSLSADWMALADLRQELVRHGEHQRASKELPGLFSVGAADKVAVARVLARCVPLLAQEPEITSSQCSQLQERYAAEAVQELAGAVCLGFSDFDSLEKDSAFGDVRGREDYRKLLPTIRSGSGRGH